MTPSVCGHVAIIYLISKVRIYVGTVNTLEKKKKGEWSST
jgi:hypothetical protein